MKLRWSPKRGHGGNIVRAQLNRLYGEYVVKDMGDVEYYRVYSIYGRGRRLVHHVEFKGKVPLLEARRRIEFILMCLDNILRFEALPGEELSCDSMPQATNSVDIKGILTNRVYQHHSGGLYRVLHVANVECDSPSWTLPTSVVYRCIKSGAIWARPLSEFNTDRYALLPLQTNIEYKTK